MLASFVVAALAAVSAAAPTHEGEAAARFGAFIQEHGRDYGQGSQEYTERLERFEHQLAAIDAHNSQPERSWNAGVNHLADRLPSELGMLRGYRHSPRRPSPAGLLSIGSGSAPAHQEDAAELPSDFTWKGRLAATREVRNQGGCGSCWAISSTTVLRAHAELYQQDRTFSTQELVECTQNPNECGGQGGCTGATAELAMEYAAHAGLATEEEHEYKGSDATCTAKPRGPKQNSFLGIAADEGGGAAFGMTGWETLPENELEPLLVAVYEKGPVVVSIAAGDEWNMYLSGIMPSCGKEAVINHAVVLVGYGVDGDPYWHIQNSWGAGWGEDGFLRMFRHTDQDESEYCGWDRSPEVGTGCKGGPSKVKVCGSCGILYDSVVPKFSLSSTGFLSRHSRDSGGLFTELNTSIPSLQQVRRH